LAKRTRGGRRDRRRGRSTAYAPPVARPAAATTQAAASGDASPPAAPSTALPSSAPHSPTTIRSTSALSIKAADEYRYVALDLRRIVVVLGSLFGAIIALWVAIDVMKLVSF
jgi:hypothetical protein